MRDTRVEIIELLEKVWPEWNIVREIGEGSFGKVYEVRRKDIGGIYEAALKVISIPKNQSEVDEIITEGMDEGSATQYFQSIMEELVKEFALMERLKGNTNIVTYEDHKVVAFEEGVGWNIFIRMELLMPLTERLKSNFMDENDVIKLGKDICRALELCQKHDIIHRDIKPENIFISEYGDYKLGDFGIARTAEKTMAGMSKKGTYTYMAPEVYKGDAYNATVDIYSLGIVLYRLLNDNRSPFLPPYPQTITFNAREEAQRKRLVGEEFPKPAHGSEELANIIKKACAYVPRHRFKNAREFRDALESLDDRVENITYQKQNDDEDSRTLVLADCLEDRGRDSIHKESELKKENENSWTGKILWIASLLVVVIAISVVALANVKNENVDANTIADSGSVEELVTQEENEQKVNSPLEMYAVDVSEYPDYSYYSVPEVSEEEYLGDQCFFRTDFEEAIQHYEKAGDLPRVLYKIGKCYWYFSPNNSDEWRVHAKNAANYIMRSAEGGFPDAQAELGLIMDGYYKIYDPISYAIYSECCNYYNPETEGYEYWMNLAVENGYSTMLKEGYDFILNTSDMEINEFIDKEFEFAMRGDYWACYDVLSWYTGWYDHEPYPTQYKQILQESSLGDFEEKVILDALAKVVTGGEYNYATILEKESCVRLLALWAARNEDYEMLEMVDEELEKIEKYIGNFKELRYIETASIWAAASYNNDDQYYTESVDASQYVNYFDKGVIIFIVNGAPIYDASVEVNNMKNYIIDYLQTDRDIYAVEVNQIERYDEDSESWYLIWGTTLPQDKGGGFYAIRSKDVMDISYASERTDGERRFVEFPFYSVKAKWKCTF